MSTLLVEQELAKKSEEEAKKHKAFEGDFKKFSQVVSSIPPPFVYKDEKNVGGSLKDAMQNHATAVGFAVIDKGEIKCVGVEGQLRFQDPNSPPVTTESLFITASIAKPVTAYAMLHCLAEYKVDLDAKIDEYFPSIPTTYPFTTIDEKAITGSEAAELIAAENEPVKQLELIAQFKSWAELHPQQNITMDEVNKLEQAILQKHEFLYGSHEIRKLLQKFKGHNITIRQLLEHSSGIMDPEHGLPRRPDEYKTSTETSAAWLYGASFDNESSHQYRYSNTGYTVAECLLERLTGKPFPEAMQQYVFGPLKMQSSTFSQSPETWADRKMSIVNGQNGDGKSFPYEMIPRAAGGMHTTLGDYAKFMREMMRVHSDSNDPARQMFIPQKRNDVQGRSCNYGLGISIHQDGDEINLDHSGSCSNAQSIMHIDLKRQQAAVIMLNSRDAAFCRSVMTSVGEAYEWPNLQEMGLKPHELTPIPENQFSKRIGQYKMDGCDVSILIKDNQLMIELPWPRADSEHHELFNLAFDERNDLVFYRKDGSVIDRVGKLEPVPKPNSLAQEWAISQEQDNQAEEIQKARNFPGFE